MENPAPTTDTKSHKSKEIKSLRILCFGDSLTAGYSSYGNLHYPYAAQIRKELKKAFPATNVNVVVSGLSGDRVLAGQYLRRMKGMCATDHYPPYDWIIVLGGTNDLGWDERPDKVYDALKHVWKVALDTGSNVLALSVIEAEHTSGGVIERRTELNDLIARHSEDRWYYMDLCSAVPYFSMSEAMRERIWDDGLHLTMDGYEMMGDAIATSLIDLLHAVDKPVNAGSMKG
ncbi:MAG: hypothetical protein L6R40_000868 [Gallowayella cf. fulva]|nr:MAG: hypothetical protein L6R40_000868 [Xanthomendoza cf. fulva]